MQLVFGPAQGVKQPYLFGLQPLPEAEVFQFEANRSETWILNAKIILWNFLPWFTLALIVVLYQFFRTKTARDQETHETRTAAAESEKAREGDKTAPPHDSSALTGFRTMLAFWIMLEHAGMHYLTGAETFCILSGCVLSLSRRRKPGTVKVPFRSLWYVVRFIFVRWAKLMPAFWFSLAWKFSVRNSDTYLNLPDAAANVIVTVLRMPIDNPQLFFLGYGDVQSWFVHAILVLYVLYPFFEMLIFDVVPKFLADSELSAVFPSLALACVVAKACLAAYTAQQFGIATAGGRLHFDSLSLSPDFVLGMLLPHINVGEAGRWIVYFADFAAMAVATVALTVISWDSPVRKWISLDLQCGLAGIIVWSLCFGPHQSFLGRLATWHPLVRMGQYSYCYYLYSACLVAFLLPEPRQIVRGILLGEAPILHLFSHVYYWLAVSLYALISAAMSWTTHHAVEVPFHKATDSLIKAVDNGLKA